MAERPETLDGKLIYLVDCLFDNSENFMRELEDWFGKNLPSVKTRLIQPRQSWIDDAEMRAKVAREGDGAIRRRFVKHLQPDGRRARDVARRSRRTEHRGAH